MPNGGGIHSKEFVDAIDRVAKSEQLAGEWPVYRDFEVEEKGEEVYVCTRSPVLKNLTTVVAALLTPSRGI